MDHYYVFLWLRSLLVLNAVIFTTSIPSGLNLGLKACDFGILELHQLLELPDFCLEYVHCFPKLLDCLLFLHKDLGVDVPLNIGVVCNFGWRRHMCLLTCTRVSARRALSLRWALLLNWHWHRLRVILATAARTWGNPCSWRLVARCLVHCLWRSVRVLSLLGRCSLLLDDAPLPSVSTHLVNIYYWSLRLGLPRALGRRSGWKDTCFLDLINLKVERVEHSFDNAWSAATDTFEIRLAHLEP